MLHSFGYAKALWQLCLAPFCRCTILLLSAAGLWLASPAFAATQTWIGPGGNGGTGTWGTSGDWSGSSSSWISGDMAVFGGTAGTVTVGTQTASGLIFNVGGYTLATGTLTLNTGSVITTNGGTTTFASSLSLAGAAGVALTKTGSGTLALSTSNGGLGTAASPAVWTITGGTYSSSTGIFDSILSIGAGNNLGTTPTNAATQVILDAGTLQISGTGLNPAIGANRTIQVNAAGGAIEDSTGNPFQGGITDNAGSASSLYLSNISGTSTFSGVISGTGGVTWNGAGTALLSGTNTYGGGTTINAGIVSIATNANLGANTGAVTLNGGTLATTASLNGSATTVFAHNIATGTSGGTIDVGAGTTLALNYFGNNATGNLTGSGPLTKADSGQLVLSGNNSGYSGNWTVNGGILEVQYNGSTSLGSGSVTLAAGTEMSLNYANTISNAITSSGGTLSFASGSGGIYSGTVALTSGTTTTVGLRDFYSTSTARSGSISGVISGAGALATSGAGVLTLSGTNTYSGGTTINTGTISFSSDSNLGADSGAVTLGGGTISDTGNVAGNQSSVFGHNIATGTVGGTIDVAAGDVLGLNYYNNNSTGDITGSGPLVKTSTGQLIVSGNNSSYAGNWTISAGTLEVQYSGSTSLGTGSIAVSAGAELALDYGNTISNTITSSGGTISFDTYGGGTYSGTIALTSGTTTTIGLRDFYNTSNAESGSISGVISGAGALATSGAGTLTVTAANTYTGATTISGGTLQVKNDGSASFGQLASTTAITVNNGGTLLLSGAGNADRINNAAPITLGSVGTNTIAAAGGAKEGSAATVVNGVASGPNAFGLGALTLSSTATVDFDSTTNGNLLVFNTFSGSSAVTVTNWTNSHFNGTTNSGLSTDDRLVFDQNMSSYLGDFNFGSGAGVGVSEISLGGGYYELGFTAVPEPSTIFGGLILIGVVSCRGRRHLVRIRL